MANDNPLIPSEEKMVKMLECGLHETVQQIIETHKLQLRIEGNTLLSCLKGTELWLSKFVTVNKSLIALKQDIHLIAKCDDSVLITGETGTGKELIAKAMIGDRSGFIVSINCAGLPEGLVESELFGYVEGAFTGAVGTRQGACQQAKDGVLFLDEVGELPMSIQAKLLRALQEKKVRRVGGKLEEDITCKFVFATHRDIKKMVVDGRFRQDLYARISTFEIHLPSLRDRREDVEPIIQSISGGQAFLAKLYEKNLRVSDLDLSMNVRSLQMAVRRFTVLNRIQL